jgi:hypothetical protein
LLIIVGKSASLIAAVGKASLIPVGESSLLIGAGDDLDGRGTKFPQFTQKRA